MDTQKHVSRKQNVGVDGLIPNTVSRLKADLKVGTTIVTVRDHGPAEDHESG